MENLVWKDKFDWRGCSAVQFDPKKLGGRGNVDGTRMMADSVLENYDYGVSEEEIAETYQLDLEPVKQIIAFANAKRSQDLIDWHGCGAVQFDPEKLSGSATVGNSRLDANTIILNYEDGMSIDELHEHFHADKQAIRAIILFFETQKLKMSA